MTMTDTPAPETSEPNDPAFTCAACGHKARTHSENGYGPCGAKVCAGRRSREEAGACTAFVFAEDPADNVDLDQKTTDAPEEADDPPAAAEDPDVETTETLPDDAAYAPTDAFDPSRHLRILTHTNRKTGAVTESHYLDVKWRMTWLRSASGVAEGYLPAHPKWRIEVDSLLDWSETIERGFAIFRARLWDTDPLYFDGVDDLGGNDAIPGREALLIAEGHGSQDRNDWHDFIEKAETKAIGRCLIAAGYGTAAAAEFEEGDNISEGGVAVQAQGQPGVPVPECDRGHGTGPVRLITSRFGEYEGQEIYWCGAAPDGGQKCGWSILVSDWKEQLRRAEEGDPPIEGDPGDPNEAATEAEQKEDAAPTPGESRTASSGSGTGSTASTTDSPPPASGGTQPPEPSARSRPARPTPSGGRKPLVDSGAIPSLLSQYQVQIPAVMARWEMTKAIPAEFARIMDEQGVTLEEMIKAAAEVTA
jgi:hypothetical protein